MDDKNKNLVGTDPVSTSVKRTGAVCAFAVVAGYLATFPLYALVGIPPPTGLQAQLEYFGLHANGWWAIACLMIVTDLLLIPLFLALYKALSGNGQFLMQLAVACLGLFVALDIAITWTAHSVLIASGTEYVATSSSVTKASLLAGAAYPSAILDSPIAGVSAIVMPSLGIFLVGLVMLRGVFGRPTAYLAIAAGITAFAFMGSYAVEALAPLRIVNALMVTVWYVMVGVGLFKLARR